MPFGLKKGPATFQRVMNIICSSIKWQFLLVHLDDTVIFSQTERRLRNHRQRALSLLKEATFILKLKACAFFMNIINDLCHIIHPRRLDVGKHTTYSTRRLKLSVTKSELRSFNGSCNVLRRFFPNLFRIAASLTT